MRKTPKTSAPRCDDAVAWVALALERLPRSERPLPVSELRRAITSVGGPGEAMPEAALQQALLSLAPPSPASRSPAAPHVTCTPPPAGWIPRE